MTRGRSRGQTVVGLERIGVDVAPGSTCSRTLGCERGARGLARLLARTRLYLRAVALQETHHGNLTHRLCRLILRGALVACMKRALPPMNVSSTSTSPANLSKLPVLHRQAECGAA